MAITVRNINQKPGYKQTEVGFIPEDWEVSKVGAEFEIKLGKMLDTEKNIGLPKPYLGNKAVQWNHIDISDLHTIAMSRSDLERFRLRHGDLLVCEGGEVGRAAIWEAPIEECYYQKALHRLRPLRGFNPRLMLALLRYWTDHRKLADYVSQTSIAHLTREKFIEVPMPVPPSDEQRAIATTLSDVDALITSLDKLIAKKREIKQATMQQLLTGKTRLPGFSGEWKEKRFGEIFQFLNTANNSRSDLSENGEIKYIHYGDIHMKWRSFLDCSSDELPLIQSDKVRNVPLLEDGDLVMADASEDLEGIGISVEVKNATSTKVVAGLHTFLLRGDNEVLAQGFKGYLQYIPAVKESLKKAATGISVYGISKNNVRNISICLPDITEQRAIAAILSDMDAEIAALEQKRDKTRSLKQGMMQELLTGKTRLV